ncbi:MAG: type II toxin-antitoxin system VapC family toxin [Bryobacteraceae bacterium]
MRPVLVDTGVIVALLDRAERYHAAAVTVLEGIDAPLVTCEAVIAESCYLLRRTSGAPEAVVENVAQGVFQIPISLSRAADSVVRLLRKYRDVNIDFADACLIQCASVIESGDILTLDSDFRVYRWGKNREFRMLIPLDV